MSADVVTAEEEDCAYAVTCCHCAKRYQEPRMLTCLHTFCTPCLRLMLAESAEAKQITCPLCASETKVKVTGVEGLPVNVYLEPLLAENKDWVAQESTCDVCEKPTPARAKCLECQEVLCDACVAHHQRQRLGRGHHVVRLSDKLALEAWPTGSRPSTCRYHSKEMLRFYCTVCGVAVCRDCKLTAHEGHKTEDLATVAEKKRGDLQNYLQTMESSLKNLKETLEVQEKNRASLLEQKAAMLSVAESFYQRVQSYITQSLTVVQDDIEERSQALMQGLEDEGRELQVRINALSTFRTTVRQMLRLDSDLDVVCRQEGVEASLRHMCQAGKVSLRSHRFWFHENSKVAALLAQAALGTFTVFEKKLKLISRFDVPDPKPLATCAVGCDDVIWVAVGKALFCYDISGRQLQQLLFPNFIRDIASEPSGTVYVIIYEDKVVKAVKRSTLPRDFVTLDFVPSATAVTDKSVVVFASVVLGVLQMKFFTTEAVWVTTISQSFPCDSLRRITVGSNIELCIGRGGSLFTKKDRIVLLNPDSVEQVCWNASSLGRIVDVCCDTSGHVIVCDGKDGSVKQLTNEGKLICCLLSRDDLDPGFGVPCRAEVDSHGRMWVLGSKGVMAVYQYHLDMPHKEENGVPLQN